MCREDSEEVFEGKSWKDRIIVHLPCHTSPRFKSIFYFSKQTDFSTEPRFYVFL